MSEELELLHKEITWSHLAYHIAKFLRVLQDIDPYPHVIIKMHINDCECTIEAQLDRRIGAYMRIIEEYPEANLKFTVNLSDLLKTCMKELLKKEGKS